MLAYTCMCACAWMGAHACVCECLHMCVCVCVCVHVHVHVCVRVRVHARAYALCRCILYAHVCSVFLCISTMHALCSSNVPVYKNDRKIQIWILLPINILHIVCKRFQDRLIKHLGGTGLFFHHQYSLHPFQFQAQILTVFSECI